MVPGLVAMLDKPGADGYWARFALDLIASDAADQVITNHRSNSESLGADNSSPEVARSTRLLAAGEWSEPAVDPGGRKLRGAVISFVDGHVERHAWRDGRTLAALSQNYHGHDDPWPGNVDLPWLRKRTTVPK